ncbi:hypothetical protein [Spiroplasma turonicum]|uniref:Uncharacterized protein n=1 Tax=Spiroplasma turonicum TaxID=216946 RepID=A0A0K1P6M5_9MOLU|nr:hypothetical protein [Spiroplasma turonicum]AKU79971.1 hypothetical protein STURON_00725 [Spiroplasma turonicum]
MYVSQLDKFGVYESDKPLGEYHYKGSYEAKHPMVGFANVSELNVNGNKDEKNLLWYMVVMVMIMVNYHM